MIADKWNAQTGASKQLDGVDVTATVEGDKLVFTQDTAPATHTDTAATTGVFGGGAATTVQNNGHEVTVTVEQEPAGTHWLMERKNTSESTD